MLRTTCGEGETDVIRTNSVPNIIQLWMQSYKINTQDSNLRMVQRMTLDFTKGHEALIQLSPGYDFTVWPRILSFSLPLSGLHSLPPLSPSPFSPCPRGNNPAHDGINSLYRLHC